MLSVSYSKYSARWTNRSNFYIASHPPHLDLFPAFPISLHFDLHAHSLTMPTSTCCFVHKMPVFIPCLSRVYPVTALILQLIFRRQNIPLQSCRKTIDNNRMSFLCLIHLQTFKTDRFRVFCHWLVNHSTFGNVILLCIMCSSALLAVERPIAAPDQVMNPFWKLRHTCHIVTSFLLKQTLKYLDYIFVVIFTVELVLKLITYGFIMHKGSFCRSAFNLLDLLVVVVSLISVYTE